jgi:hypothetical protein
MPSQCLGHRIGRPGRIPEPAARCGQSKPRLTHVVPRADCCEQRRRTTVIVANAGSGERKRHRIVLRREPAGTVEPALRLGAISSSTLGLAALERLECERRMLRRRGQRPTACVSAGWASAGGGRAARSVRAS